MSNGADSHTSSYQDVRGALKDLEAFSLNSSEEINENIEQLIDCIENNAAALNKAITDLTSMPNSYPNYSQLSADQKHQVTFLMIETAMKITEQFENFHAYTKKEV